jgi:CO/xanthine dehydrogenase Mo-binding subunit
MPDAPATPAVGRSVFRKDGMLKTTGAAKYADDISFPGMLYARTIRSSIPRGRIRSLSLDFDTEGFTIVDHRDIPGPRCNFVALIEDDQPFLAAEEIHHMHEPILLLAHEDRGKLRDAVVRIEYEEGIPLLDAEASERVFKELHIRKGDISAGERAADLVVEGTYRTGYQEHVYIEPNGVVAHPEEDGGMTVYGSMQCPYYVHKALKALLELPDERVRVVQTETGGGFGGKEEYPNIIAGHAALLARKSGRPVKLVYDRVEDMLATTKRHPSITRNRTGVMRDGTLVFQEIDFLLDGGAYVTLSPVVLSRGCIHAGGPYRCDNVHIRGRAVMTNTPPNGAFRGFGAPQSQFATEVHMERIAEALGMDPVELRERNALRPGDTTATGQRMGEDCSALETLRGGVEGSDFHRKRREYADEARAGGRQRGIGLALFFHGSGFTGAGEVRLGSKATLETTERGVLIRVASVEMGQGTRTMHAQIVADALGIPYEEIEVAQPDTAIVPDSGPTVASRTCMVVGKILERCAREMRRLIGELSPAEHFAAHGPLEVTLEYEKPEEITWDDTEYQGDAYASYGWGLDVVEVELDPVTYEVHARDLTVVHEIGKAIHPTSVVGQIEGGTAQGVGWALNERVVMVNGGMANPTLTNYTIPTTLDTPRMKVIVLENPTGYGPFGAKGVGEMPIDGPAPAVVNAIRHLGLDVREIPAIPEVVMGVVEGGRRQVAG